MTADGSHTYDLGTFTDSSEMGQYIRTRRGITAAQVLVAMLLALGALLAVARFARADTPALQAFAVHDIGATSGAAIITATASNPYGLRPRDASKPIVQYWCQVQIDPDASGSVLNSTLYNEDGNGKAGPVLNGATLTPGVIYTFGLGAARTAGNSGKALYVNFSAGTTTRFSQFIIMEVQIP